VTRTFAVCAEYLDVGSKELVMYTRCEEEQEEGRKDGVYQQLTRSIHDREEVGLTHVTHCIIQMYLTAALKDVTLISTISTHRIL
jgi:hypothetical protein